MSMCQNFRLKYPSTCWIGCFAWFWQVMNQDFVFGFQDIIIHVHRHMICMYLHLLCVCVESSYILFSLCLFNFYIMLLLTSYYHILTQYIILEFKISNTKILNLDSPPTHSPNSAKHKGTETQATPKAGQLWDQNANSIRTLFRSIAIHF